MKKILIVEDLEPLARVEEMICSMDGYDVRVAHSGEEGLATAAEFQPDLVLLDLVLSGDLDGEGFLAKLPNGQSGEVPKVLVVSGMVTDALAEQLRQTPGVDVLAKPFSLPELSRRIEALLY